MRKLISMWMIVLVGILTSCHHKQQKKDILSFSDTIPVQTGILLKKEVTIPINISGQFLTNDETILSFKTGGIINAIFVREGEYVRKGQVLASLNLTEIKSQVSQAELNFEKTKRDFDRVKNLYRDSVATLEQYQNCKTAFDVATEALNGARFNLNYSQITAFSDGYILKKFANTGQYVASGIPILQCNSTGKNNWKFRASISDKEWSAIAINDGAEIITEAFPQTIIKGTVSSKSKITDPFTGTFFIEINIKNIELPLATGLYGKATINPQNTFKVWAVPYEALLEGNAGNGFVFITNDDKIAQKVKVSILYLGKNEVYVGEGLDNVKCLIISGSAYLADGSLIKVNKVDFNTKIK